MLEAAAVEGEEASKKQEKKMFPIVPIYFSAKNEIKQFFSFCFAERNMIMLLRIIDLPEHKQINLRSKR